jgi:SNF2 family DNA or RNA helicase
MKQLYKHQEKAIESIPNRFGLWHEPGLGKSATSINLVNKRGAQKVLVVCPKSLVRNWKREIDMWSDGKARFTVLTKEQFKSYYDAKAKKFDTPNKLGGPFDCLIIDEAHYNSMYTSGIHKATLGFLRRWNPPFIWALTATPILSSVMSVWGLSRVIGKPLGNYIQFQRKYFRLIPMGGRSIPVQKKGIEEDIADDLKTIGDVVKKEDALDLPDTVHLFEYFTLTKEQNKAINDLDNDPTSFTPIVYHTKCLQISNGTLKMSDGTYQKIRSEKIERIKDLVSENPRVIVVCRQTAELEILHKEIPNSRIFNGQTSVADRDEIIQELNDGKCTMLAQADMCIGWNGIGVSTMIFYSHTWDYVKYEQSLGRIHRIGQNNKCTYIHMVTEDTIDESVWKCLERKETFQIELYNKEKK